MDFNSRLERLRHLLTATSCDGMMIEHPIDLFYLTGLHLSTGKLLISQRAACLIVDDRYLEYSSSQKLYPVERLKENVWKNWLTDNHVHYLGFDQTHTTYQTYLTYCKEINSLQSQGYSLEIVALDSLIQQLRMIKDEDEIKCLRAAGHLCFLGYEYVVSLLKEGITESELAFELEFFWKKKGANRLAFDAIIAFGPNSSMPHYRAGKTVLTKNTSVLIDIGAVLADYHSDMTRVVFFGQPLTEIQEIYQIVEEAKLQALALCRPGTLIGELDQAARHWITSKGYGDYFTHSLGHGVGLDIHEPPTIRQTGIYATMPLQPGMVITIEPGIYLPKKGGVRLEDTILITETGYEILTL